MDWTDLLPIGGALLGAGSSGNSSASTNRTPWAPAQPWLTQNLGLGQAMQNAYLANPLSALQQQAYSRAFDTTNQGRALGNNLLRQMNSTQFFDRTNPTARPSAWSFDVANPNVATAANPNLGFGGMNLAAAMPTVGLPKPQVSNNFVPQSSTSSSSSRSSWDQTPSPWDSMSDQEKADWYSQNPTMSAITQGLQNMFGMTALGKLQQSLVPSFVENQKLIAQGYGPDKVKEWENSPSFNTALLTNPSVTNTQFGGSPVYGSDSGGTNITDSQVAAAVNAANNYTPSYSSNSDGSYSFSSSSDSGDSGDSGDSSGSYAKGGMVKKSSLSGPNPKGPDEGKANLQSGEYVIRKAAVKKYGKGLLSAINEGRA